MSTLHHRTHFLHLKHLVPQLAVIHACACTCAGKFSLWIITRKRSWPGWYLYWGWMEPDFKGTAVKMSAWARTSSLKPVLIPNILCFPLLQHCLLIDYKWPPAAVLIYSSCQRAKNEPHAQDLRTSEWRLHNWMNVLPALSILEKKSQLGVLISNANSSGIWRLGCSTRGHIY